MRLVGHVDTGERVNANNILVGKPLVTSLFGRHVFSWEDAIKEDFKIIML
jgi:hypothetical protein